MQMLMRGHHIAIFKPPLCTWHCALDSASIISFRHPVSLRHSLKITRLYFPEVLLGSSTWELAQVCFSVAALVWMVFSCGCKNHVVACLVHTISDIKTFYVLAYGFNRILNSVLYEKNPIYKHVMFKQIFGTVHQ